MSPILHGIRRKLGQISEGSLPVAQDLLPRLAELLDEGHDLYGEGRVIGVIEIFRNFELTIAPILKERFWLYEETLY